MLKLKLHKKFKVGEFRAKKKENVINKCALIIAAQDVG